MTVPYLKKGTALIVIVSRDILTVLDKSHEPLNVSQLAKELKRKPGIVMTTLKFLFRHGWVTTHRGKWRYKQATGDKDAYSITKSGRKHLTKLPK